MHIVPCRADQELAKEVDKLQHMVEKLQRSLETNPRSRPSNTEATLMQCAREVIIKGTAMYEASPAGESVAGGQGAANSNVRVAEWLGILESIRRDQHYSNPLDIVSNTTSVFSEDGAHTVVTSATSMQSAMQEYKAVNAVEGDSDDDLDTDLAKSALDTGTKAFEAQEWEEANSLLQEALRVLQQLPKQQRAFCNIFRLQYKLAVCAYHLQEPTAAEEALMSLARQPASSDEEREHIYVVAHLLSLLYIRMGQVDRARFECEKTLQARRRLLGKQSDASLESTALLAHIYILLNNRARAKSYLAMIPEARRDAILKTIEESLDMKVEHPDSSSLLTRTTSEDSDLTAERMQSRLSASSLPVLENRFYSPMTTMTSQSPTDSFLQSQQRFLSYQTYLEDLPSVTATSLSLAEERNEPRAIEKDKMNKEYSAKLEAPGAAATIPGEPREVNEAFKGKTLSRKDILEKIGCQPKDRIEEAVCDADHSVFANILSKKTNFWQSKLRKRVRPERVTALHFAALFGELDMAQRLLNSSFNINALPYGYSTRLTPLHFAIGARQVDMVEFLIGNGAKPSEPDSWSTLAGLLMNRSWLMKTMSDAEKEHLPSRIIGILKVLLNNGWEVNAPFETSGETVLHQAVAFWMGSYKWDLNLRVTVTKFLCERGANPFRSNTAGKTPYDIAVASGHQDLLLVISQGSRIAELDVRSLGPAGPAGPAELSS